MHCAGIFSCPFFSVSNAPLATGSYASCNIGGLCGGDRLTASVCSIGGSFTGGMYMSIYSFTLYIQII